MTYSTISNDLPERVAKLRVLASQPGREVNATIDPELVDLEAWDHVGDPIAEALIIELRSTGRMQKDIIAAARSLAAEGSQAAVDFFQDAEHVPAWLDFESLRAGADMGYRNPIGFSLGMHGGLPFTYVDPNIARVMAGSGRLGGAGDYRRRFWETATGFLGALDVDGMKPGGKRWEMWLRIRLMHTMVRLGILRSGAWDPAWGSPISTLATAGGVHVFGQYRANVILASGGFATREEVDSWLRMWQWVTKLQGVPLELLPESLDAQRRLDQRILNHMYRPNEDSRVMTAINFKGLSEMHEFSMLPLSVHEALGRYLLSSKWVQQVPGRSIADDLSIPEHPLLTTVISGAAGLLRMAGQGYRLPFVGKLASKVGQRLMVAMVDRGLDGVKADYKTPM